MFPYEKTGFAITCSPKPPIGIDPKEIWIERRRIALRNAIDRYKVAGFPVPVEWYEEYYELMRR